MPTTLYRGNEYYQIWEENGLLRIQKGIVGNRGEIIETKIPSSQSMVEAVESEVSDAQHLGFVELHTDALTQLVVCYHFLGWQPDEVASFHSALIDILGNALTWTANGIYDGFTLGVQCLSLWFFTVHPKIALKCVLQSLVTHGFIDDDELTLTVAVREGDVLSIAYPSDRKGTRFM